MSIIIQDGPVIIEIDDGLRDTLDKVLGGAPLRISRRFQAEALATIERAKLLWPVRAVGSKGSRDRFGVTSRIDADGIETVISNSAPYAYKIKWSKYTSAELQAHTHSSAQAAWMKKRFGSGAPSDDLTMRSPWQITIKAPIKRAEPRLAEDIEADLTELLEVAGG